MNESDLNKFRQQILATLADLQIQDDLGEESQRTVTLDQQSVGRLSRMDAMQQQAMAKATQTRRNQMKLRIKNTLTRMDEGEFGCCADCGEDIPIKRLELDPTVATCVSCASN